MSYVQCKFGLMISNRYVRSFRYETTDAADDAEARFKNYVDKKI